MLLFFIIGAFIFFKWVCKFSWIQTITAMMACIFIPMGPGILITVMVIGAMGAYNQRS